MPGNLLAAIIAATRRAVGACDIQLARWSRRLWRGSTTGFRSGTRGMTGTLPTGIALADNLSTTRNQSWLGKVAGGNV